MLKRVPLKASFGKMRYTSMGPARTSGHKLEGLEFFLGFGTADDPLSSGDRHRLADLGK
jgi:hypothetical protein